MMLIPLITLFATGFIFFVTSLSILSRCVNDGLLMKFGLILMSVASFGSVWKQIEGGPNQGAMSVMVIGGAIVLGAYIKTRLKGQHIWTPHKPIRGDIACRAATPRWR